MAFGIYDIFHAANFRKYLPAYFHLCRVPLCRSVHYKATPAEKQFFSAGVNFLTVCFPSARAFPIHDEAAKATKELIENSISVVGEGSEAVGKVTAALEQTSQHAGNVSAQMDVVVEAIEKQTTALGQVNDGIDQISSVVQTNSAKEEESAAASQQLSAEAAGLKTLVDQFTLSKD